MWKALVLGLCLLVIVGVSGCTTLTSEDGAGTLPGGEGKSTQTFKILHIMSYHSPWEWTDDQLVGFKKAFEGVEVEYKVFQMDTKRHSDQEWIDNVTQEAKDLIESWKPDIVYTNDDNAQKNLVPGVKKIAVIFDEGATWPAVKARMQSRINNELRDIEIVSMDTLSSFAVFKQKMNEYQDTVDAVGLIGIFTFKDENGTNVPHGDVLKWVADNSNLPDFSFWTDRIGYGTLCAMAVSAYEQGLAAGKIARGILLDGKSPSSFPFEPTVKGNPFISLARANKLNISVKSDLLLSAEIVTSFVWED
jgi:hypothetical protein